MVIASFFLPKGYTYRLQNLTQSGVTIRPAVNQVELNFWNPQPELVKVCLLSCPPPEANILVSQWAKENDILLEAYSPLGGSGQVKKSLDVPEARRSTFTQHPCY